MVAATAATAGALSGTGSSITGFASTNAEATSPAHPLIEVPHILQYRASLSFSAWHFAHFIIGSSRIVFPSRKEFYERVKTRKRYFERAKKTVYPTRLDPLAKK